MVVSASMEKDVPSIEGWLQASTPRLENEVSAVPLIAGGKSYIDSLELFEGRADRCSLGSVDRSR